MITPFIIIVVIALFMVLIGYTWYRLEAYEGMERVIISVVGILISWLITTMLFNLSAKGLDYTNLDFKNEVSKILILVFTPINGIVFMPYVGKIMSQYKFDEIEKIDLIKKSIIIIIVMIVISIAEFNFLKDIQTGIFEIASKM